MSQVTELERLVVRLVGDDTGLDRVLDSAVAETKKATREIEHAARKATRGQKRAVKEAARGTKAAVAPLRQYRKEVDNVEKAWRTSTRAADRHQKAVSAVTRRYALGSKEIARYAKRTQAAARKVRSMGLFGSAGAGLPVVGAVGAFATFDDAMNQSLAIMGNVSAGMRKEMADLAVDLSHSGRKGAKELAQSYFFLASAGLGVEESIAALPVVTKFATAGMFDMALATDLLTDAQSALGLSSKDATENMHSMQLVSDTLVKANTLANASVQQFSEALTNDAGAAINQFNMDLAEGVAILAAYADQGLKGNPAGSMMARGIRLTIAALNDNKAAFDNLGISTDEFSRTGKNFIGIVEGIARATEGLGPAAKSATLETLGFQARIQQAILPLLDATEKARGFEVALRDVAGTTAAIADKQLSSFLAGLIRTKNQVVSFARDIGEELAPAVMFLSEGLEGALALWRGLHPAMKTVIASIVGITAVVLPMLALLSTGIIILGHMTILFASVGAAGVAAIGGILALAAKWSIAVGGMAAAVLLIADAWTDVDLGVEKFIRGIEIKGTNLGTWVDALANLIVQHWEHALFLVGSAWDNLLLDVRVFGSSAERVVLKLVNSIRTHVAAGMAWVVGKFGDLVFNLAELAGRVGLISKDMALSIMGGVMDLEESVARAQASIMADGERRLQGNLAKVESLREKHAAKVLGTAQRYAARISELEAGMVGLFGGGADGSAGGRKGARAAAVGGVGVSAGLPFGPLPLGVSRPARATGLPTAAIPDTSTLVGAAAFGPQNISPDDLIQNLSSGVEELENKWAAAFESMGDAVGRGFEDALSGARTAKEAIAGIIQDISRAAINAAITQPLTNMATGFLGSMFGGVFGVGRAGGLPPVPSAKGNVFNRPVSFPLGGGRMGTAAENGPEAIMPLQRDENGTLGLAGGGRSVTVVQHITTPDAASFRRSAKQTMRAVRSATGSAT